MKLRKILPLFWFLTSAIDASGLPEKIQQILDSATKIQRGFLGLAIVNAASGEILFESNSSHLFTPASNTKLFTIALGLTRLGADYRFHTTVRAQGAPDSNGRIAGQLTLVGGGDPNLSGRELPYRLDSPAGDGLQAIEDLASQVAAHGVRRIDGDIVGDDTAYLWDPYPDGWGMGDAVWEYGAPVSALTINDNAFRVSIQPGDPARIALDPPLEFYHIDNQVRTGPERKIFIDREAGSRQVRIWGTMPTKGPGLSQILAIHDPALYAAAALRDALARRGIAIHGEAVARHWAAGQAAEEAAAGVELARRESAPLLDDLRVTAKVSQNLHAELILRAVARANRGAGSVEAGLEEMKAFLKEIGVTPEEFQPTDGSGLSRKNLMTPAAMIKLLQFMYNSPHRTNWMSLLPVGGEDGSLKLRLRNTSAAGRIRAKTGSLSHVTSLSGYAERKDGTVLAFSFLTNNEGVPASEVRAVLDKLCVSMTE